VKGHHFTEWKVKGVKCSFEWRVVISHGHIDEKLEKPSPILEFLTWRVKRTHHNIPEMRKCEMRFRIRL
jgi:hypothetical protein